METSLSPVHKNFVWHSTANDSSFTVEFPKSSGMELLLIGAELYQDMGEHDRLVLHFKGLLNSKKPGVVGKDPVLFTFRSGKLTSKWYGYIHSIKPDNSFQGGNTNIVCVGASSDLKETDQKIYRNVTADQVITKIAKKYGMEAITQRHPRVRESIVQAGQSDWQLITRLANQTGFALRCENTSLLFVSKDKIFLNKKDSSPYFNYVNSSETGVTTRELRMTGTILSFNPIISDKSPESGVRVDRVVTGMDPKSGSTIKVMHPNKTVKSTNKGIVIPSEEYFRS